MKTIIIFSNNHKLIADVVNSEILSEFTFMFISNKRDLLEALVQCEPLLFLVECNDTTQDYLKTVQ